MPVARPESSNSRVIAHIDMDCFYVQVEQRKQPILRGHPTAVVQYNSWKGGGLIAVSYEARKYGVKRSMRGDEAKKVCPDIQLVQVPVARGKADLTVYRNAGSEVVSVLSKKGRCERASIDEVYLDLTEAAETMLADNPPERLEVIGEEATKSHILGLHLDGADARDCVREWFLKKDADHRDKLLACGALIVAELRLEVLKETEFTCSAGIAHNKMLAKLASGMNKPSQQTIVPQSSVEKLLESLPVKKMKQLGGKLGTSLQVDLGVNTVGDLLKFSNQKLQELYGINTGTWLWNIARGVCGLEVEGRLLPKSHGSGKTFPGPQALETISSVKKWLHELCEELSDRLLSDLNQNKRIARTLTLHASAYKMNDSESIKKFPSKSCPLRYGVTKLQEDAMSLFNAGLGEYLGVYHVGKHQEWAITGLSISASKIVVIPSGTHSIMKYFCNQNQTSTQSNMLSDACTEDRESSDLHLADLKIDAYKNEAGTECCAPILNTSGPDAEVVKMTWNPK
ncbi:DNA polymerase eta isoform X2 [Andrographis paniculata]|uniref:DNA polymerase eta isoform X2 n=1 Tax=Andrographis paniculata TaxID=175694 RepID=UPI0021E92B15|nr:DNA polymerase eta isoform X2 [Andrographis paniculata]